MAIQTYININIILSIILVIIIIYQIVNDPLMMESFNIDKNIEQQIKSFTDLKSINEIETNEDIEDLLDNFNDIKIDETINMKTELDKYETICKSYKDKRDADFANEDAKHKQFISDQLEIENLKIIELTEIVNYYKSKSDDKIIFQSMCDKQTELRDTGEILNKLCSSKKSPTNTRSDTDCAKWAGNDQCTLEHTKDFMMKNCCKACLELNLF